MSRSSSFTWIVFLLWLDSAIAQVAVVTGYIGGSVVMPCLSSSADFRPDEVNVYWRDRDDNVVLDVVGGVQDPAKQHQRFRGRVLSRPDQNRTGNFSIVLQNLREDDAGVYECHIPSEDVEKRFKLEVTGKPVTASPAPPPPSSSPPPPAGRAALSLAPPLLLLLLLSSWQRQ